MSQGADDFPLNANGPAYTSWQDRHGVPLSYVANPMNIWPVRSVDEVSFAMSALSVFGPVVCAITNRPP